MTFEPFMIAGFILIAFGWWGTNTPAGIRVFASPKQTILPVAALILGSGIFARGLWLFVRP